MSPARIPQCVTSIGVPTVRWITWEISIAWSSTRGLWRTKETKPCGCLRCSITSGGMALAARALSSSGKLDSSLRIGKLLDGYRTPQNASPKLTTPVSELKEDRYNDAATPYGKTVNAFMIVEGWRIDYLLWLIAISLVVSIGVVCGVAVVSHSLDDGLTAGTYALGFFTIPLAAMTLLSAVL